MNERDRKKDDDDERYVDDAHSRRVVCGCLLEGVGGGSEHPGFIHEPFTNDATTERHMMKG
jgi:hypothetical protein